MFKAVLFDSDGVILNSNSIKLNGFYHLVKEVSSKDDAVKILHHIRESKGLSRYDIIDLICTHFCTFGQHDVSSQLLLARYSDIVFSSLVRCQIDEGIFLFKELYPLAHWFILTAGDTKETEKIYQEKHLDTLFGSRIFGSPRTKQDNLNTIMTSLSHLDSTDILFIGDSFTDAELAIRNGLSFALITHWSHCEKAKHFCERHSLPSFYDLKDLIATCSN